MTRLPQIFYSGVAIFAMLLSCQISLAQPSVNGTVFLDGAALSGVELTLYADDGDMNFDLSLDSPIATMASDPAGQYGFSGLQSNMHYFVYQGAQSVGSLNLLSSVSGPIDPFVETMLVDAFEQQQRVEGNPIVPTGALNLATSSIIGGQRDLRVDYQSGPAEIVLHANPWGMNQVLQFDQSAGSMGVATITWDGLDSDMSSTPMTGGMGMDLTQDGGEAFAFMAGIDKAGSGDSITFRIFSGSHVSTAVVEMPVTNGTASTEVILPFSSFVGTADFTSVDAIQAELGGSRPSIDAQLGPIHISAGSTANLTVATPEPASGWMAAMAGLAIISQRKRRKQR